MKILRNKLNESMRVHFVGIGGVGLSAMARILLQRGFHVSGSDRIANVLTERLSADGAIIQIGHEAGNVDGANVVIVSSAISTDNTEIDAARAQNIPVYKRADIIMDVIGAGLEQMPFVIAVAGTHGKTTTTSMIAHMMITCGLQPGYIIGGVLSTTNTNADAGGGEFFVIEADEYDNMFHGLRYDLAVITNIEWDHPDFFKTPDDMMASFERFVTHSSIGNCCTILCDDDPGVQALRARVEASALGLQTYGLKSAANIHFEGDETVFGLAETPLVARINRPGAHNVLNALGALQVMFVLSWFETGQKRFTLEGAIDSLASFNGAARRFEVMGERAGVLVINDYAHHPTAIRATLAAAKARYPERPVWSVWQPHTFSRTKALWGDYLTAFVDADHVVVTEIYAAREGPIADVTSVRFVAALSDNHPSVHYASTLDAAADFLIETVGAPAIIIIMSAGDAPDVGTLFLAAQLR